jgi:hypothetical protein
LSRGGVISDEGVCAVDKEMILGGFNSQVRQMSGFHYATNLVDLEYTFKGVT